MTDTITIALDKLDIDPNNARKTRPTETIEEMAASLKANGQIQNLVVREGDKKGHYLVTAGGTRWAGFKLLAANGDIKKSHAVRCIVRTEEEATEISLAENIVRSDMHPIDAYLAFSKLAEEGKTTADIAARFGKTEHHVKQRLALAKVSPVILQLYRDEDISFEQLQAFTVSDDHALQEDIWSKLSSSYYRDGNAIRRALTGEAIPATDKRVKFIGGLTAFEAAGGEVRRDLFDEADSGLVLDASKLENMVAAKLQDVVEEVKAEGWLNVEIIAEYDHESTCHMQRYWPQQMPLTEEEQAEYDQFQAEYDDLETQIEAGAFDDNAIDDAELRLGAIDQRMVAIDRRAKVFTPEIIATGTTFISLDYQGKPNIQRGYLPREEQTEKGRGASANNGSGANGNGSGKAEILYSATLIESLSAQKTAILRAELMNNSHVALAATVHALLQKLGGASRYDAQTCLKISLSYEAVGKRVDLTGGAIAQIEVEQRESQISERIPGDPVALWEWCLEQSTEELLDLLAFAAAQSINVVELKHDANRNAVTHGHRLAEALKIDMASWYQPTGESLFKHLNRNSIQIAVKEAVGEQAALAVANAKKKDEAVIIAERLVKDTSWLPDHLRINQPNAVIAADPEDMDDIEQDDDIDPCEVGEFEDGDFEQAAE
ncbi:ParB/RepB/Spo0J family partition protein [Phyllobacterium sp. P30BS-XVII]|uniref:ParB/RepB/Spo0J family partition protein n=1 Tax=Phyllobacterium sp. P30BS-XVII TaxID=2587046 RepID=UPI0015FA496B|nr:ParB/RepB/Spo0J family partition protein [Phyllobacterium sp. P30BS-XVII]MBA8904121.1 ParB family chromosome partitioning protein [Phyllobacterium sp. P30BS-XVII]